MAELSGIGVGAPLPAAFQGDHLLRHKHFPHLESYYQILVQHSLPSKTPSAVLLSNAISSTTIASPWLQVPLQGLCRPRRLSGTQQMPPPWPEEKGNCGSLRKYPNILSASTNMISLCKHLVGEFQHSVAVSFSAIFDLHVSSTDDYFTVFLYGKVNNKMVKIK